MAFTVISNALRMVTIWRTISSCRPTLASVVPVATNRRILSGRVHPRRPRVSLLHAMTPMHRLARASGTGWW